jgi:glycosyltransferase involved in cell wall biosynthesis
MNSPNSPLVSIIMVVRNGERYIGAAIKSVVQQYYEPFEIIVVDGQSNDNTAAIVKSTHGIRYLYQDDLGLANARNMGIEASRGALIAFLDHDDVWGPGKLKAAVNYLREYPDIEGVVSKVKFFLQPGCVLRPGFNEALFNLGMVGYTPSALVARKSLFQKVGMFNPDYSIGCDADWFARVRDGKIPMGVVPGVVVYKRIHADNLSANTHTNKQELLIVLKQSLVRKRTKMDNKNLASTATGPERRGIDGIV